MRQGHAYSSPPSKTGKCPNMQVGNHETSPGYCSWVVVNRVKSRWFFTYSRGLISPSTTTHGMNLPESPHRQVAAVLLERFRIHVIPVEVWGFELFSWSCCEVCKFMLCRKPLTRRPRNTPKKGRCLRLGLQKHDSRTAAVYSLSHPDKPCT